jgi:hypothetical protein
MEDRLPSKRLVTTRIYRTNPPSPIPHSPSPIEAEDSATAAWRDTAIREPKAKAKGAQGAIPNKKSLKSLEELKYFLETKLQANPTSSPYLISEIKALDKTISFIKVVIDNLSNDKMTNCIKQIKANPENNENADDYIIQDMFKTMLKKMVRNKAATHNQISRLIDKKNEADNETNKEIENELCCFKTKFNKNRKVDIVLSRLDDVDFILFALKRRNKDKVTWRTTARIKMSLFKFKEILSTLEEIKAI